MNITKHILYLYTETPMHVGTGVGLGAVDMPIQREKHTNYPMIQASGLKGALRDTAERDLDNDEILRIIFGSDRDNRDVTHASAMSPSDARILLFPVRALNGVFVWVTSPTVLERFKQETGLDDTPRVPSIPREGPVLVSANGLHIQNQIMLEEYTYHAQVNDPNLAQEWGRYFATHALRHDTGDYWKQRLQTHLAILPDDEFRDFVRYSTDIVTRIHLDNVKKTVKDGQLFTQELLPADSLLYSLVHVTDSRNEDRTKYIAAHDIINSVKETIGSRIQIGGDETVGRGRVRLNWQEMKS